MNHITLAQELADLYPQRAAHQIVIELLQASLDKLTIRLAPLEGWEGKNQELRDLAKARAFLENQEYTELQNALNKTRGDLLTVNSKIEALEAQRRGLEMFTRIRLTEMLMIQSADLDALIDQALHPKPDESELVKSEEVVENDNRPYCLVHECYNCTHEHEPFPEA